MPRAVSDPAKAAHGAQPKLPPTSLPSMPELPVPGRCRAASSRALTSAGVCEGRQACAAATSAACCAGLHACG